MQHEWLFDAGSLALDLTNTERDRRLVQSRETLPDPTAAAAWAEVAGISTHGASWSLGDLRDLCGLRDAIYRLAVPVGAVANVDVDLVNASAARAPHRQLARVGESLIPRRGPITPRGAIGLIAEDAISTLLDDRAVIKECAHHRCGLLFVDRSRGGRRTWCSMQRCGNRMKAARFATRTRTPAQQSDGTPR